MRQFIMSLIAYLRLYNAGFRISHSALPALEIYRFYWHGNVIKDMADIDCANGRYSTMQNGHSERLS